MKALFLLYLGAVHASALTLTVTTELDQFDTPSGADLSLREAIRDANNNDTIEFDAALSGLDFQLLIIHGGTLLIDGKTLTIDASSLAEPIKVSHQVPPGSGRLLTLQNSADVTIDSVHFSGAEEIGNGGGILVDTSTLSLESSRIEGCSAFNGGGIASVDSDLTITNSTISHCSSDINGGGIRNSGSSGTLTLTSSRLEGCEANFDGGGIYNDDASSFDTTSTSILGCRAFSGGGIFSLGTTLVRIGGSSLVENGSRSSGGALFIADSGSLILRNSTVAHNQAINGGGCYLGDNVTATLNLVTMARNSGYLGGGIHELGSTLTLRNSVIAENTARRGNDIDLTSGSITRVEQNFIGDNDTVVSDFPQGAPNGNSDYAGTSSSPLDPRLGGLGRHGGGTLCMPPLTNSQLIDNAGTTGAITVDQRGFARSIGSGNDLGSVEAATPVTVTTVADEDDGALGLGVGDSLREVIAYGLGGTSRVEFDPLLSGSTITLASEITLSGATVFIDGSGPALPVTVDGANATRLFHLDSGASVYLQNLTLHQGSATTFGGAVYAEGDSFFSASDCSFTNNASTFQGGAIRATSSPLVITSSNFSNNSATGISAQGGAISTNDRLDLLDCSFTSNDGTDNSPVADPFATILGGAIHFGSSDTLNVLRSSFSSNTVSGQSNEARGGAIYAITGGRGVIMDSTIANNTAITTSPTASGGGVHSLFTHLHIEGTTISNNFVTNSNGGSIGGGLLHNGANLDLINSTISGNSCTSPTAQDTAGGIRLDQGNNHIAHCTIVENEALIGTGGIQMSGLNTTLTLENSIVANTNIGATPPDIDKGTHGTLIPLGPSFIGNNDGIAAEYPFNPPLVGSAGGLDPHLGTLQNNGGPTETQAPDIGSPVIDAAQIIPPIQDDQRGLDRVRGSAPDLGAYEFGNASDYITRASETIPSGSDDSFEGSAVNDNTANGLDYATLLDPLGNPPSPLDFTWISDTQVELSFPYYPDATDIVYRLRHSSTLLSFTDEFTLDLSDHSETNTGFVSVLVDPVTSVVSCVREISPTESKGFWILDVDYTP